MAATHDEVTLFCFTNRVTSVAGVIPSQVIKLISLASPFGIHQPTTKSTHCIYLFFINFTESKPRPYQLYNGTFLVNYFDSLGFSLSPAFVALFSYTPSLPCFCSVSFLSQLVGHCITIFFLAVSNQLGGALLPTVGPESAEG